MIQRAFSYLRILPTLFLSHRQKVVGLSVTANMAKALFSISSDPEAFCILRSWSRSEINEIDLTISLVVALHARSPG